MIKPFPRKTLEILLTYLLKKGYSYREIQEIFNDVRGYNGPSLAYISKFANATRKKK